MASSISSFPFFPTTAPAYAPCRFSPAATYPPAPFPGGYHTSAFPYSGAYPYPPPADAYTPAHGLSPNRPNWPPPSPDPTLSTTTTTTSSTPTFSCVRFSPPPPAETSATASTRRRDRVPALSLPTDPSRPMPQLLDSLQAASNREHCKYQTLASSTRPDPALLNDFKRQLKDLAPQVELARRMLLDMSRRLDEYQAQSNRSFASLRSGISKLVDRASSKPSTRTAPTQSAGFTPSSASTTMNEFSTPLLFNTGVAEISAASSSSSSFGGSFAVPKPASALTVPAALGHVASQVLDEMPQRHGLDNLNRQSLYREDGTKDSYFTLPADYSIERDVPEPVFDVYHSDGCSNEFVHVFSSTPKQQSDEEEEEDSEQLLTCISKATASEQSGAYLNYISGVPDYTLEQRQNDDKKTPANLQQLRDSSCSVLITHERRKEWDPGDTNLHVLFTMAADATKSHCTGWTAVNVQQLRDTSLKVLITHESRKEWDPGDNTILSSALNRDIVVLQTSTLTTSGIFTLPFVLPVRVQFGVPTCVPQQSCFGRVLYSQQNFGIQFLWDPGILRWRTISAQHILESGSIFSTECMLPWNPSYSILLLHHFLLEFSMDRVLNLMNLKHFWALLSLQFYSWCTILDAFLRLQYYCLPIVFDCLCPEPVQQLVCYYSLFRSTAMSMSTATTVHMRLVLGSGKIAQEEKDVAAIYQVLKIQLLMRKTAHIWDPGIEPILFLYKELHVHKIQQVHCSSIHACYFCVFAMLPPTQMLYAYTLGFLNGQGEFLDQQGVQRNYSAKHLLLFSDNYLQIWELDIIFITFLPP